MPDYTPYQKKLIGRYYGDRDNILLTRLQEIVTELTFADSDAAGEDFIRIVRLNLRSPSSRRSPCDSIVRLSPGQPPGRCHCDV